MEFAVTFHQIYLYIWHACVETSAAPSLLSIAHRSSPQNSLSTAQEEQHSLQRLWTEISRFLARA
jgi:hypothetical protein